MDSLKKPVAVIYYRDLPLPITMFLREYKKFSYVKDGTCPVDGHHTPRLTIHKEPEADHIEDPILDKLDLMLQELASNNQIVAFRFIKKY